MAELATLQSRLSEAEEALHSLMVGKRSVTVQCGDKSVTFTQANLADLRTYIGFLRGEIAAASSSASRVFTIQTSRGLS